MNAIVAVDMNWGIGYNGVQTIVVPEDRKYFGQMTAGGVVIVGRKTFEGIPGPLPNRKNIVLTRDEAYTATGAFVARSVDDVLAEVAGDDPNRVFVIGGEEVYRLFLPMCRFAYVTKIEAAPRSDAYFPDLDAMPDWTHESCEPGVASSECGVDYSVHVYANSRVVEETS